MTKKRARQIYALLERQHPGARPELNYKNNFELLIAVILSAQCTDIRVNKVTADLFKIAPDPESMANMEISELEALIKTCGLFRNKAKFLKKTSKLLLDKYNGEVPSQHSDLMKLAGVSQKTANVVLSVGFGVPAIAVDTHVFRVSKRLGLTKAEKVHAVENDLMKLFDKDKWIKLHHLLIFHGRYICKAQKPVCNDCLLAELCSSRQ